MSLKVKIYKHVGHRVKVEQTAIKRDWMDQTVDSHAYKCFPVAMANTIGWSVSFLDDIEFIWDGISDTTSDHVKILKQGSDNICNTQRANASISFYTGLFFKTDEDMSIIQIPPPNYFIDGAIPFTSVISTSFYEDTYPVVWRITRPNVKILIPAETPVATFIPLSLKKLSEIELDIYDFKTNKDLREKKQKRLKVYEEISKEGKFTNFYRDAKEYDGTIRGSHELKSLKMKINDFSTKLNNV